MDLTICVLVAIAIYALLTWTDPLSKTRRLEARIAVDEKYIKDVEEMQTKLLDQLSLRDQTISKLETVAKVAEEAVRDANTLVESTAELIRTQRETIEKLSKKK